MDRPLERDDLVEADVGVEGGLDLGEDRDGAVGAAAAELALRLQGGRDGDTVVERQAKRFVRLSRAQTAVEQVLLEVLTDCEQLAARRICRGVDAVGAGDAARQRGWVTKRRQLRRNECIAIMTFVPLVPARVATRETMVRRLLNAIATLEESSRRL